MSGIAKPVPYPYRYQPSEAEPVGHKSPPGFPGTAGGLLGPAMASWGYWFFVMHLITVWGIALSNFFLGLMILWWLRHRRLIARTWLETSTLMVPLGIYVIFTVISVIFSLHLHTSLQGLRELINLSTLALGLVLVRGAAQVRPIFTLLICMTVGAATVGIGQYIGTDAGGLHQRIVGPFSHYQTFSGILLLGLLALVAQLITGSWRHLEYWLALGWITWALILTLTRGAWVALFLSLLLLPIIVWHRHWKRLAVALVVLLAVGWLGLSSLARSQPNIWTERLFSVADFQDASNYDRLCMIEAGLFMIRERPMFGIGPGMVRERYMAYRHPTAPREWIPHLHNSILQIAAERGLLTLLSYCLLCGASLSIAWKRFHLQGGLRGPRADIYLTTILGLVGFNLAGLFENNWQDTEVQRIVLFLLAAPLCLPEEDAVGEETNAIAGEAPLGIAHDIQLP